MLAKSSTQLSFHYQNVIKDQPIKPMNIKVGRDGEKPNSIEYCKISSLTVLTRNRDPMIKTLIPHAPGQMARFFPPFEF